MLLSAKFRPSEHHRLLLTTCLPITSTDHESYYVIKAGLEDEPCQELLITILVSNTDTIDQSLTNPSEFPKPYLHISIQSNDHPSVPIIHMSKPSIKARKLNPIRPLQPPLNIPLPVPNKNRMIVRPHK